MEYFGPRDLVLDGQSVSGDNSQLSTDLTNVNKEANTQTWDETAVQSLRRHLRSQDIELISGNQKYEDLRQEQALVR